MTRWVLGLLALVAVVAGAGWFVFDKLQGVPVLVDKVRRGPIHEFVDERAKTRLPRTYLVTMPYTGRIEEITLEEGTPVSRGQTVARLVPSDLQLAVDEAQAAVDRLDAAVKENDDKTVELTGLEQAIQFVNSMDRTVEAAEERVRSGKAKNEFAQNQYRRSERLLGENAISQEEFEQSKVAAIQSEVDYRQDQLVHSAMLAMQAATALMPTMVRQYISRKDLSRDVLLKQRAEAIARLEQAKQNQARGTLNSPVDGVVLARHESNERNIAAGTELMKIGRLEDLEIEAEVLSQDVVDVKPGNRAEVYGPAVGKSAAQGVVTRVFPAGFTKISSFGVEQQRVKVIIKLTNEDLQRMLNERDLGVDFRVHVKIYTDEKDNALVVPRSAFSRGATGEGEVFAVRGGRARRVKVKAGLMNDELVEIMDGLQEGEPVVLAPDSELEEGDRVTVTLRKLPPNP